MHSWLNKLLNYLKNFGMHLNSIRPEFLLSYQDLILFWKLKDSKKVFVKKYKLSLQQYNLLNKYAWCTLFFQIIKGRPHQFSIWYPTCVQKSLTSTSETTSTLRLRRSTELTRKRSSFLRVSSC